MSKSLTFPWVRVPEHDYVAIGFALNAGASIIIPRFNTVAKAQHAVSSAKYGLKNCGTRSAPPFRLILGVTALLSDPNETHREKHEPPSSHHDPTETTEVNDNLDAILTEVPDIDAVWLGTLDIRVSMDSEATGEGDPEPEYSQAVVKFERILNKTCRKKWK
ncbi:MAG: hypothetical protein ASARMPRED_000536 [Alectoria sarmentosa]|nr:MAG: hypothetical protein ASARMPRED_000536 [Alectoria sarmentosa]